MSQEEKKNVPTDPLAPEVPEQAKAPETPTTRVEQQLEKKAKKVVEYKKDIKFLWIYSTVFCLVALALIGGSYIIQNKIHAEMDDYKSQAESATQSDAQNKSRLSTITEKNQQLTKQVETLTKENATLRAGAELDEALITKGEEIIHQQQLLLQAIDLYGQNKITEAKEAFALIKAENLPEESKAIYTYYEERMK